jgi:hypothetical protein
MSKALTRDKDVAINKRQSHATPRAKKAGDPEGPPALVAAG